MIRTQNRLGTMVFVDIEPCVRKPRRRWHSRSRSIRRARIPWTTTAVLCISYGIGRFIDEFWRGPDQGQPMYWGWMSKGQLLTIPMIVIGVILAIRQLKQDAVPKG